MPNRHVFLDFDGVLVDSNSIKTAAFLEIGMRFFSEEAGRALVEHHKMYPGGSRYSKLGWLLENFQTPPFETNSIELELEFRKLVIDRVKEADRVQNLPALLKATGHCCHILSAAPVSELTELVACFGWDSALDGRVHGSPMKKEELLRSIPESIDWANSILVGDSSSDFAVAKNFGLSFAFISGWSDWQPSIHESSAFLGTWPRLEEFLQTLSLEAE